MEYPLTSSQMTFYPKGLPGEEFMWNHGGATIFYRKYNYSQLNDAFNRAVQAQEGMRLRIREQAGHPMAYIEDFQYTEYPFFTFSSTNPATLYLNSSNSMTVSFEHLVVLAVIFLGPNY